MHDGDVVIRSLAEEDVPTVLDIAEAAWEPVFASFRELLGDTLFETVYPQWQTEKRRQVAVACRGDYGHVVLVAEAAGEVAGFASYRTDADTGIGKIGNNAVAPEYQGRGIGTLLYERVLAGMREAGMDVAQVTTGGDPSHAPARRAYEKAGFNRALPSVTYYLDLRM